MAAQFLRQSVRRREDVMHELRRLLPRQFTDWQGKYMIEDDPDELWRECRVVDMSSAGAGLELLGVRPEELPGHKIILAVQLRGEVRNFRPAKNEGMRVGIQFSDLTPEEREYLDSLMELKAAW